MLNASDFIWQPCGKCREDKTRKDLSLEWEPKLSQGSRLNFRTKNKRQSAPVKDQTAQQAQTVYCTASRPTYITATLFDPFFHEFWTSTTRKGSAFHSAGYRGSPFPCTVSTGVPHIAPIHINWLRDQASSRANNMKGGSGPRAMPANQPASPGKQPTAHNRRRKTTTCLALSCNMSC